MGSDALTRRARELQANYGVQSITASAVQIRMDDSAARLAYKKRSIGWQEEAWRYYHEIEIIWAPFNMLANILSRVRIFAARETSDDQEPEVIDDPAHWAVVEMARLENGDGVSAQLRAMALTIGVSGESWLIGRLDDNEGEVWKVYSCDQVFVSPKQRWAIRDRLSDRQGVELDPASTVMVHIWREDPQWASLPDSAMRPLLGLCEELQILTRMIRSSGRSRTAGAGMLLWPAEAVPQPADPNRQYEPGQDIFVTDLIESMLTPIRDEGTAAGVVPLVVKVPEAMIDKVKHLTFDRPIDPVMAAQRVELINRISYGLPLPPEMVVGFKQTTYANAFQVSQDLFSAYVEPFVLAICNAYTRGFLKIAGQGKADVDDVFAWYDATAVIGHPNRITDAKDAYDRDAISREALRRHLDLPDSDAPSDDELRERIAMKRGVIDPATILLLLELSGLIPKGTTLPPEPVKETVSPPSNAIAAAAVETRRPGMVPSSKLTTMDRELRRRLVDAADAAINRALERAGAKLRRKASQEIKTTLRDIPQHQVMAFVGKEAAIAFGIDEQEIIDEELSTLEDRWDTWVASTQSEVRRFAQRWGIDLAKADYLEVEARQDDDRHAGWLFLSAALSALALERMYNPTPSVPEIGEVDLSATVPTGLIRAALGRAGGNDKVADTSTGALLAPTGEIATGEEAMDLYLSVGLRTGGYVWVYGDAGSRLRPFPPHEDLDGTEFSSWDDDVLGNTFDFPTVEHLFPGDHEGCGCSFDVSIEQDLGGETP